MYIYIYIHTHKSKLISAIPSSLVFESPEKSFDPSGPDGGQIRFQNSSKSIWLQCYKSCNCYPSLPDLLGGLTMFQKSFITSRSKQIKKHLQATISYPATHCSSWHATPTAAGRQLDDYWDSYWPVTLRPVEDWAGEWWSPAGALWVELGYHIYAIYIYISSSICMYKYIYIHTHAPYSINWWN